MRRMAFVMVIGLLLLASACSVGEDSAESTAAAPPEEAAGDALAEEDAAAEEARREAGAGEDAQTLPATAATTGERVIREGAMRVEVPRGEFDAAFARSVRAAERLGGSVMSSTTRNDRDNALTGSLTLRVPVEEYDRLLLEVAEIGQVRERSITSQDVTTEFVDLEARLRHNEAQERFYLGLLEDAEGVQDAIAVQQQLTSIQETIERIRGRIQFLEDRTSFSLLDVELFETGAAPGFDGRRPKFADYWSTARDALVNTLGTLVVAGTILLPLVVLVGLGLAGWRTLHLYRRRQESAGTT